MDDLEAFLAKHPDDLRRREAALVRYGRPEGDSERLRHHTMLMVRYHPESATLVFRNTTAFYRDPRYRAEVIAAMERQVRADKRDVAVYVNLARLCEHGAFPVAPESRARFRHYFGLRADQPVPTRRDDVRLQKAVGYWRAALVPAKGFERGTVADSLAKLLEKMGRPGEAVTVCRSALPTIDDVNRPDFLVTYGRCLHALKDDASARKILDQVRGCDREGNDDRPGCATIHAEQSLGRIALGAGDLKAASAHLLASTKVAPCCHSTTQGLPLGLARDLEAKGERQAVAQFCRIVLGKFVPDDPETTALLRKVTQATR